MRVYMSCSVYPVASGEADGVSEVDEVDTWVLVFCGSAKEPAIPSIVSPVFTYSGSIRLARLA